MCRNVPFVMRKFSLSLPVSVMIVKQGKHFTTAKIFKKVRNTLFVTVTTVYYTGMDITCLYTSSWEFICDGIRVAVQFTSDVMITYHCSAYTQPNTDLNVIT